MEIGSLDIKVVKGWLFEISISVSIDHTRLSAAEESLFCDYPMAADYILENNLWMVLITFNGPI